MKRMRSLPFLLLAFGLQVVVILGMIGRYEWICRRGEEVRLACHAYDPFDPFRGRYLQMDVRQKFSRPAAPQEGEETGFPRYYGEGNRAPYVRLEPGEVRENGKPLHRIVEVAWHPAGEGLWMQSLQCHPWFDGQEEQWTLELDFPHQFFLPEEYAAQAEKIFAGSPEGGVAVYKVWRGQGVLVDVEVNGVSLLSLVQSP